MLKRGNSAHKRVRPKKYWQEEKENFLMKEPHHPFLTLTVSQRLKWQNAAGVQDLDRDEYAFPIGEGNKNLYIKGL